MFRGKLVRCSTPVAAAIWLLCQLCTLPTQAADVPSDRSTFTDFVARAFAKAMPEAKISVAAPLYIDVDSPTSKVGHLYLQTLFSQCQGTPDRCESFVAGWIDQMSASLATEQPVLDRTTLRAVLRSASYVDQLRGSQKLEPVAAPFL